MAVGFFNQASMVGPNPLLGNSLFMGAGHTDASYQSLGIGDSGNFSTFKVTDLGFGANTAARISIDWDHTTTSLTVGWDFNFDNTLDSSVTETYTAAEFANFGSTTVDAFGLTMTSFRNGGPVINIHEYSGAIDNATYTSDNT